MITHLLLDADGVTINGTQFKDVRANDLQVDKAKEKEFFTTKFQDCKVGKADLKEVIVPYLPAFNWHGTVDEFLDYWFKTEHHLNEELLQYAQQLRQSGIKVALATNQEKYRTQYVLEDMGFSKLVDTVYSSAYLGVQKPSGEFFAKVLADMGADKQNVLFWDDEQPNIDAAREFGINAELYTDYASFKKYMADKYGFV